VRPSPPTWPGSDPVRVGQRTERRPLR
jgi:hypothetical protein